MLSATSHDLLLLSPSPQPSPPRRGRGRIYRSQSAYPRPQTIGRDGLRSSLAPAEGERVGVRGHRTDDSAEARPAVAGKPALAAALFLLLACALPLMGVSQMERDFHQPPRSTQPWAYWWWLDGAASREGITADLEAMRQQGISGVLLFDAGVGGTNAPKGQAFMSEGWRELFRHTLREADRLKIDVGVNLCSGWNAGGTWVTPELAAKKLVWSEAEIEGPGQKVLSLSTPPHATNFYCDIAVLAMPLRDARGNQITNLLLKAGREYANNARSGNQLADSLTWVGNPPAPAGVIPRLDEIQVLAESPGPDGQLTWQVPAGRWLVLRFGYTLLGSRTKCTSPGAEGYEIDFFNPQAFDDHFAHTGKPLLEDARRLKAKSLKYFHVDSYESGNPSWSPRFAEEFRARRGYDLRRWMPVLAGWMVESPEASHRFLWDIRRTIADLYAANYYGRLAQLSHQAGIAIHPESSGPFYHQIDALQCAGVNDIPMTEFWKRVPENKESAAWLSGQEGFCDLVKQGASAAHIYGRPVSQAEAFTSMGPNWEEDPFMLKDIGDRAFCAGLTRNVLCFYVHQPDVKAYPGYEWEAAGTHFDNHITWWNMSHAWLSYLSRCQLLLRQGRFVADFLYFYGEDVPNFVAARSRMNPPLPPGFDCDTINAEVLLGRLSAKSGRLKLPDGMSYQYLVLPHRSSPAMSPAVCRKIAELVEAGATIIGPAPQRAPGLSNWPQCDTEVQAVANKLWGPQPGVVGERRVGRGRVLWGRTPGEVVTADRLTADVEFRDLQPGTIPPRFDSVTVPLDWIHRRDGSTDIYFVANISTCDVSARAAFRADGRKPELWDAVTGRVCPVPEYTTEKGCTVVPLKFTARQSFFVVFRKGASTRAKGGAYASAETQLIKDLAGSWEVAFNPDWGGPRSVRFEQLEDWTKRPEEGIRYYSGTATYRKQFELSPSEAQRLRSNAFLELGVVKNLARVRLNGHDLGVVWTAPWRVEISSAVKAGANDLEIEVVNLWPNRLIGDARLPKEQRRTVTNVEKFNQPNTALLESGLLGPVSVRN